MISEALGPNKLPSPSRACAIGQPICYHTLRKAPNGLNHLARISYEAAYPDVQILPSSRNWWAKLKGTPAECIHLDREQPWMATLLHDTLYVRGKKAQQREPVRPEVSLCRDCLLKTTLGELQSYLGRVVGFEPDPECFSQYFFVAAPDFEAAGLKHEVAAAIEKRITDETGKCEECSRAANWLWFSRARIPSLDEADRIASDPGEWFCAEHGPAMLCVAFKKIPEANLFYMNLPYGDSGAYVWI